MTTMQAFYETLTTGNDPDRHADALVAMTRANRDQLSALSSDLAWQTWGAPTAKA